MTNQAAGGDGYAAAFLYAFQRDAEHVPAATKWLLAEYGPHAYWVKKYNEALADPEHFKGGQRDLANVYYHIDTQRIIAFDWAYDGLAPDDRRAIRDGLLTCARYRIRAMDRWTQTPNLVFKPTYVVALTGLVTRDSPVFGMGLSPHAALGAAHRRLFRSAQRHAVRRRPVARVADLSRRAISI